MIEQSRVSFGLVSHETKKKIKLGVHLTKFYSYRLRPEVQPPYAFVYLLLTNGTSCKYPVQNTASLSTAVNASIVFLM